LTEKIASNYIQYVTWAAAYIARLLMFNVLYISRFIFVAKPVMLCR